MGIDMDYSKAFAKAAIAAGQKLPTSGGVFITVMDQHKDAMVPIAKDLQARQGRVPGFRGQGVGQRVRACISLWGPPV